MNHAFRNARLIFEHVNLNEVEADEVRVEGFETNDTLDPKIWDGTGMVWNRLSNYCS